VYRIALADEEASAVLRERIAQSLNRTVGQNLDGDDPELRTALFGAQLAGAALVRHLIGVEAVASAEIETVIEALTPSLRRTLLGPKAAARPGNGAATTR
jgi:hypothetical protein